jgi:L-fuculose-phosphate aldolase
MSDHGPRAAVLATARRLVSEGLTRGTSGNVSARAEDGFLITPSGMPYDRIEAADVVRVGLDGEVLAGKRAPSTEWRIHRDLYVARPEVTAVVHAHDVRCAAYATYGTEELSRAALVAMEGRQACLLANHGVVTVGASLDMAFRLARTVETVAELYWRALAAGEPVVLDEEEMARVVEKLADYGRS